MSGLLTPILSAVQQLLPIRAVVDVLSGRLTAERAAALDRLDHSVLDAVGPVSMPPTGCPTRNFSADTGVPSILGGSTLPRVGLPNTGGAWITVLDISGAGVLSVAAVGPIPTSAGLRITIDGTTVIAQGASGGTVVFACGHFIGSSSVGIGGVLLEAWPFRESLLLEAFTNGTDPAQCYYDYHLTGAPA